MLISYNDTVKCITEGFESFDLTTDQNTVTNKFTGRVDGIILQDSYNNPFFRIRPEPRLDTGKFDLKEVNKRFFAKYGILRNYLPWHFCVELVNDDYYVFNTRPLDMRFPINNKQALMVKNDNWMFLTNIFFKDKLFDVNNAIHICIIGDTTFDVYTKNIYRVIGEYCITPIIRANKLSTRLHRTIFPLNIGKKFNLQSLLPYINN